MSDRPLNPSEQVERIREILVGRQMGRVERRLSQLEASGGFPSGIPAEWPTQQLASTQHLAAETAGLKQRLTQEATLRQQQVTHLARQISQVASEKKAEPAPQPEISEALEKKLSERLETVAAEMTARVDARSREILHHLQNEILQWKNQSDRDMQSLREVKVDRKELKSRFARLASAAMEDEPQPETPDGYLL